MSLNLWRSVKTARLPRIGRAVLTIDCDGHIVVARREKTYESGGGWEWISLPDRDSWDDITHWQPLPRAPRGTT